MAVARISEIDRKTTQSGRANSGLWVLEFERGEPQLPDPLTGWNGSGDTNPQVRITFRSKQEAVAYAKRRGIDFHLVPSAPVKLKIQAYSDNFR